MEPIGPSRVREASGTRARLCSIAREPADPFRKKSAAGLPNETDISNESQPSSPSPEGAAWRAVRRMRLIWSPTSGRPRRHFASFAASILAHVALIAMILYFAPRVPQHHDWVLAYLVEMGPGNGGPSGGSKSSSGVRMELTPMPSDAPRESDFSDAPTAVAKPADREMEDDLVPRSTAMESLTTTGIRTPGHHGRGRGGHGGLSSDSGSGLGSGIGSGAGDGSGAGGLQIAHADYGASPAPAYPARSRRLAEQGTVTLHVQIAPDGSVERIEIAESSGFDDLDHAALETVRSRWRFVPARRGDGRPVESWVLVPIRFALR